MSSKIDEETVRAKVGILLLSILVGIGLKAKYLPDLKKNYLIYLFIFYKYIYLYFFTINFLV